MTNKEAKKMLEAKLKCLIAETSGTNHDCNMRLCDGCSLNYEQGNMGEQKEALDLAIKALEQQPKTGHWKEHDTTFGRNIYYCTACGRSIEILYKYDFCPNCGAKMEVEE